MSTAEVCPTCEGWCCRDGSEMHVTHRNARYAKHVCPDCDAGLVWTAYTEPAPKPVRTAEEERADVIAYLAYARSFPFTFETRTALVIDTLRDLIDQGTHIGWAKKEKA